MLVLAHEFDSGEETWIQNANTNGEVVSESGTIQRFVSTTASLADDAHSTLKRSTSDSLTPIRALYGWRVIRAESSSPTRGDYARTTFSQEVQSWRSARMGSMREARHDGRYAAIVRHTMSPIATLIDSFASLGRTPYSWLATSCRAANDAGTPITMPSMP